MKYLTRSEFIKQILKAVPSTKEATIQRYIYERKIKPSKWENRVMKFSEEYVEKIINCSEIKKVINWKLVEGL